MADLTQIGKNIRAYRLRQGLTQRALADNVMVSFQAISAWERGLSVPDLENAIRLANYFGVSVDALFAETEKTLLVGIDGGGTKTEFVLFDKNGTVLNVVRREGSNPNDAGIEHSIEVLTVGLEQLLRGKSPLAVFAGIGGVSLEKYQKAIKAALSDRFHTLAGADTDAANVLSMGQDPDNSTAIICGTGSCVFVRKGKERYRIGGWGYLLDQAGSAYDVGKDALRYALAAEDGLRAPSELTQKVAAALGGSVFPNISTVYGQGRPFIADLAMTVVEAANAGSADALEILRENAKRLAVLLKKAVERYDAVPQAVAAGSFWKCEIFRNMVQEMSGVELVIPELPPAFGACVETMRLAEIPLSPEFQSNFTESYRRLTSC